MVWLMGKRARGVPPEALGPELYALITPKSPASRAIKDLNLLRLGRPGGEQLIFEKLDRRFPDLLVGRSGFVCRVLRGGTLRAGQPIGVVAAGD